MIAGVLLVARPSSRGSSCASACCRSTAWATPPGAIAGGDLSHRVESTDPRTEVGRLGVALNAMLDRLEQAFAEREASEDRLRRFIADASHELRTPLASIRGYAELFRMGAAREPDDVEKAMRRIEDEAARMGVLVEDLLTLARLDEVRRRAARRGRPRRARARRGRRRARDRARPRDRPATSTAPPTSSATPDQLRQVLGNLLRNALVHTPAGTPIEVTLSARGDDVRLEVRDHGPGLPTERRRRAVRALLARGGRARARPRRRRASAWRSWPRIVDAHGGAVRAGNAPDGGAQLRRHAARRGAPERPTPRRLSAGSHRRPTRAPMLMAMTEQTLSRPPARRRPAGPTRTAPSVEIVVPVYNEEAALEHSIRRLHRYLGAELPVHLADRHRRQREHRRHAGDRAGAGARAARRRAAAPRPQGPRARAARGLVAQRRAGPLLHGRRPLDGPARPAAAGRAAALGAQRPRHRHPPGAPARASCAAPSAS